MRHLALILALATLSGCKQELEARGIAGRTVTINNVGNRDIQVNRVIANDQDGREECVQTVGAALPPGRSQTVTFFNCGRVERVSIDSDRGLIALQVQDDSTSIGNAAG